MKGKVKCISAWGMFIFKIILMVGIIMITMMMSVMTTMICFTWNGIVFASTLVLNSSTKSPSWINMQLLYKINKTWYSLNTIKVNIALLPFQMWAEAGCQEERQLPRSREERRCCLLQRRGVICSRIIGRRYTARIVYASPMFQAYASVSSFGSLK